MASTLADAVLADRAWECAVPGRREQALRKGTNIEPATEAPNSMPTSDVNLSAGGKSMRPSAPARGGGSEIFRSARSRTVRRCRSRGLRPLLTWEPLHAPPQEEETTARAPGYVSWQEEADPPVLSLASPSQNPLQNQAFISPAPPPDSALDASRRASTSGGLSHFDRREGSQDVEFGLPSGALAVQVQPAASMSVGAVGLPLPDPYHEVWRDFSSLVDVSKHQQNQYHRQQMAAYRTQHTSQYHPVLVAPANAHGRFPYSPRVYSAGQLVHPYMSLSQLQGPDMANQSAAFPQLYLPMHSAASFASSASRGSDEGDLMPMTGDVLDGLSDIHEAMAAFEPKRRRIDSDPDDDEESVSEMCW